RAAPRPREGTRTASAEPARGGAGDPRTRVADSDLPQGPERAVQRLGARLEQREQGVARRERLVAQARDRRGAGVGQRAAEVADEDPRRVTARGEDEAPERVERG